MPDAAAPTDPASDEQVAETGAVGGLVLDAGAAQGADRSKTTGSSAVGSLVPNQPRVSTLSQHGIRKPKSYMDGT
jgi:hypothetical protein